MTFEDGFDRVRKILIDEGATPVFSDAYLLDLMNDATAAILNLKPTANVETITEHPLSTGAVQELPSGAIILHDVVDNFEGDAIRRVDREQMDAYAPGWRSETATDKVVHFMYDDYNPKQFMVYPPNTGNGKVTLQVTQIPSRASAKTEPLPLSDDYFNAFVYYTVARALDADTDDAATERRVDKFYARFAETLGVKIQNRMNFSANMRDLNMMRAQADG